MMSLILLLTIDYQKYYFSTANFDWPEFNSHENDIPFENGKSVYFRIFYIRLMLKLAIISAFH